MSLREIMDEQPKISEKKPWMSRFNERVEHTRENKDLRPIIILGIVVVYSVTVVIGASTMIVLNINTNGLARACIESGGDWKINSDGERECVHPEAE